MSWFKREGGEYGPGLRGAAADRGCAPRACGSSAWAAGRCSGRRSLQANLNVCPKCQHHFKIGARQRIDLLLEPGYELVDGGLRSTDPLNFTDVKPYKQRLRAAQEATGLDDAILNAVGRLGPHEVVVSAMEYGFIGGSMGAVVGETIARAVDRARAGPQAADHRCGIGRGAHDGGRGEPDADGQDLHARWRSWTMRSVPYICVLTDPTTGGVTASFAMLGDLNIAEPGALIGFAGPRVIEQTIRQKLPEGFQRSEFLLEKGFLDAVVHRRDLKAYLIRALDFMKVSAVA